MRTKQQDIDSRSSLPSRDEHDKIVDYLISKGIFSYIYDYAVRKAMGTEAKDDLISFFYIMSEFYGRTQYKLVVKERKYKHHSDISRLADKLNIILEEFSKQLLNTPVQLFFSIYQSEKAKPFGCHFACSTPVIVEEVIKRGGKYITKETLCSHEIIPLEQAIIDFDPYLDEFRNSLKDKALKSLTEKLHGENRADYKLPDLQIGHIVPGKMNNKHPFYIPINHNREWKEFNVKDICGLNKVRILSGETGSGKSTFLLNLQLEILEDNNSEIIPLYIEANQLTNYLSNDNSDYFLSKISNLYLGYLKNEKVDVFLKKHSERLLFLVDGLDQSGKSGTGFKRFVDNLTRLTGDNLIVSSRPFAASVLEKESNVVFLRLMPFNPTILKKYFGDDYKDALNLCKNCSYLLNVPMLAYMVRRLIKKGLHGNINTRKKLYDKFIEHIFERHVRDKFDIRYHDEVAIVSILRELSYNAIVNDYFLRIPFDSVIESLDHRIIFDDLLKFGIADMLNVEGRHLHFTHPSFREYLAAAHIAEDKNLIKKVLEEKLDPKWEDVIKFLVGFKGQEIIETILDENDNPVHSKLFFAAKLVPHTTVDSHLDRKIKSKLQSILDSYFTRYKAEDIQVYIDYISKNPLL